ncbi:hypothetical protein CDAR_440771 [Caerostris darwini]|uniref:Uncharacterized protein n=1 Tax=Caerostris darwini TaxID=1538125 RepID=A0AAV4MQH5_9ARAC|nr:hypothetical protein CDAR_440771 [Caerostris darwini]
MLLCTENTTVARRRRPRSVIWEKHQPFVAELKITISLSNSPPIAFLSSSSCAIRKKGKKKRKRKHPTLITLKKTPCHLSSLNTTSQNPADKRLSPRNQNSTPETRSNPPTPPPLSV